MKRWLIVLLSVAVVFGAETLYFTPKKILELKSHPRSGAETLLMLSQGMLLLVKSVVTDSAGREWYMVNCPKEKAEGFVSSADIELLGDESKSNLYLRQSSEESEEKRARLAELRKHPDWPRRIRSAVHNGSICLKMTTEQLAVSWKEPYARTSGFILGAGEVQILFYRPDNPVAIVVKNNEIIGWSEKN